MPTMVVTVEVFVRNAEGEIIVVQSAQGTTDDGGATVVIGNGNVPDIENVPASDIKVTLHPAPIEKVPEALTGRVDDAEANTSTLTFTFPA